jgi:hypothetical protein
MAMLLQMRNTFQLQRLPVISSICAPLCGHLRHRQRDRRVDIAGDEIDPIVVDQLIGFLDARGDIVAGIGDQQLDRPPKNAAAAIDLLDAQPGARYLGFGERGIGSREGLDHAHFHRLFGARPDCRGCRQSVGGQRQAGLKDGAAPDRSSLRRHHCPHGRLRISDGGWNIMRSITSLE